MSLQWPGRRGRLLLRDSRLVIRFGLGGVDLKFGAHAPLLLDKHMTKNIEVDDDTCMYVSVADLKS